MKRYFINRKYECETGSLLDRGKKLHEIYFIKRESFVWKPIETSSRGKKLHERYFINRETYRYLKPRKEIT